MLFAYVFSSAMLSRTSPFFLCLSSRRCVRLLRVPLLRGVCGVCGVRGAGGWLLLLLVVLLLLLLLLPLVVLLLLLLLLRLLLLLCVCVGVRARGVACLWCRRSCASSRLVFLVFAHLSFSVCVALLLCLRWTM